MKPLGKIKCFTKDGTILVQSLEIPSIRSTVVTRDLKKVGTVKDVIGLASKPYILVKPIKKYNPKDLSSLKEETLYVSRGRTSKRRRKDEGKKGRVYRQVPGMPKHKPSKGLRKSRDHM